MRVSSLKLIQRRWLSQNACTLISDAAFAQGVPDSKVRYLLGAFAKLLDVLLIAEVEAQQQGATERLLPACDALFSRLRHSLVHDAGAREEAEHVFQVKRSRCTFFFCRIHCHDR